MSRYANPVLRMPPIMIASIALNAGIKLLIALLTASLFSYSVLTISPISHDAMELGESGPHDKW